MAIEVVIPKLGMTMTEGCVAEWRVPDGGEVQAGQTVYLLETEKIKFDVEAESPGTVRHLVPQGTALPVGAVVAYILASGESLPEDVSAPPVAATARTGAAEVASGNGAAPVTVTRLEDGRVPASPIARRLAKEAGVALEAVPGTGPGGRIVEADVLAFKTRPVAATPLSPQPSALRPPAPAGAVLASPLARRLAEQLGIDLARVQGTGPGGRITREDVEQAVSVRTPAPSPAAAPAPGEGRYKPGDVIPMRSMRQIIAERMHASLQEMAQLTMGMTVVMDEAVKLRTQLVAEWEPESIRPSYTDIVIKAVAKALRRHPLLNARITEQGIELLTEVHIGVAVALDDGLVVPVIRDADRLPLKDIAAASSRLASAARGNRLMPDDLAGGTFSVTPLGMYGVDFFTPIINPPNVAILGVGAIHDTTAWEGDRPVRRQEMTLSLTIDHRAVDGAPAAEFLSTVRDLLQAPYRILV